MFSSYLAYLRNNPHGYWFKRKLYGWGWTPVTWQGWTVTLTYVIALILLSLTLSEDSSAREVTLMFILPMILLTVSFVRVCYKKGESPKWQWGREKK